MGTRSFIAHQTEKGFEGVYCHYDGYLAFNGKILDEHYDDSEKVAQLIAGGDISTLAPTIGHKHNFHDFDNRPEGQTTFYHRDRGDVWRCCQPKRLNSMKSLLKHAGERGCEYVYLFDDFAWHYAKRGVQYFGISDGSEFLAMKPIPENYNG